jgi:lysophospholipase L1-like esterase
MELTFEQIANVTCGAVRAGKKEDCVHLYRFSSEQEKIYELTNNDFYKKTFSTAGIKLVFQTNSESLFLKINTIASTSRSLYSVDVLVNGKYLDCMKNYDAPVAYECNYLPDLPCPNGINEKSFRLGKGDKIVEIVFPWSVIVEILSVCIDDNSYVLPVIKDKILLCYGDSITHGYDAIHPTNRYSYKLANLLGADEINKAIGGDIFFPPIVGNKEDFDPDYIIVAYGTNDWAVRESKKEFLDEAERFFQAVRKIYPKEKIVYISPIWRGDYQKPFGTQDTAVGDFEESVKELQLLAKENGLFVVDGLPLTPHHSGFFADQFLHPNDLGFGFYAENLLRELQKLI